MTAPYVKWSCSQDSSGITIIAAEIASRTSGNTVSSVARLGRRTAAVSGAELPEAGALRWRLSTTLEKQQRADQVDLTLIAMADRLVMLVGRGELVDRHGSQPSRSVGPERKPGLSGGLRAPSSRR